MKKEEIDTINEGAGGTKLSYRLGEEARSGAYVTIEDEEGEPAGTLPTADMFVARAAKLGLVDPVAGAAYLAAIAAFNLGYATGYRAGERYGRWAAQSDMRRALGIEDAFLRLERDQRREDARVQG